MTFTIPEFWCGMIVTVGLELIALIVTAVIRNTKDKHKSKYTLKK